MKSTTARSKDNKNELEAKTYSISEAAHFLRLSAATLRRWESAKVIHPTRTIGHQRRYSEADIQAIKDIRDPEKLRKYFWPVAKPVPAVQLRQEPVKEQPTDLTAKPKPMHFFRQTLKYFLLLLAIGLFCSFLLVIVIDNVGPIVPGNAKKAQNPALTDKVLAAASEFESELLSGRMIVNVPSFFNKKATFKNGLEVDIATVSGSITAPNIVYSLIPGTGITISSGQTPTISALATGVTSFQGKTGAVTLTGAGTVTISGTTITGAAAEKVTLTAGSGITVSGYEITNSDPGTAQLIFSTIDVDGTEIAAASNTDTLSFISGTNVLLTPDASGQSITIDLSTAGLGASGWTDDGTTVRLTTITDRVGIGTSSPLYNLDVNGTLGVGSTAIFSSTVGIGTTDPCANPGTVTDCVLDVKGTLRITGSGFTGLWLPTNAFENYVLTTDATGKASWTNPSGSGSFGAWTLTGNTVYPNLTSYNVILGTTDVLDSVAKFVNTGSSLYKPLAVSNLPTGGNVGTAAATVDIYTSFNLTQTTAGQTITLPTPTSPMAGRLVYLSNTGSAPFTFLGSTVLTGTTTQAMWNGTAWTLAGSNAGLPVGTVDNSTMRWNQSTLQWLENVNILSTATGEFSITSTSNTAASLNLTNNTATTIGAGTNTLGIVDWQSTSLTTGNFLNMEANALTSGKMANISSTSTVLSTGNLLSLDWSPASAPSTAATGDLFKINVGANGANMAGNLINITDNGSSLFAVNQAQIVNNLPASFNAAGDVSLAYDLVFTNPTIANIKSQSSLSLIAGESFNSSDLTLGTYNVGSVVVNQDNQTTTTSGTSYAFQVNPSLTSATNSLAHTWYGIYSNPTVNVSGSGSAVSTLYGSYIGLTKSAGTIDKWYGQYIAAPAGSGTLTASYALVTEASAGNVGIGTTTPGSKLVVGDETAPVLKISPLTNNSVDPTLWLADDSAAENVGGFKIWYDNSTGASYFDNLYDNNAGNIYFRTKGFGTPVNAMTILGSGNVGIGTTAPSFKLDVRDSQAATAAAQIYNTSTATTADGLIVKVGNDSVDAVDAGNYFISFESAGIGIVGKIQGSGAKGVSYTTEGQDLAEWFSASSADEAAAMEEGDIVCLGNNGKVEKCHLSDLSNLSNLKIVGVVSAHPAFLGGHETPNSVKVALVGQVPVKIEAEETIHAGDFIDGAGKKLAGAGYAVGRALESSFGQTAVRVKLEVGYHVSEDYLADANSKFARPPSQCSGICGQEILNSKQNSNDQNSNLLAMEQWNNGTIKNATVSGSLNVLGKTTLTDLTVIDKTSIGLIDLDGNEASLSSLGGTLKIQPLALDKIEFEGGKIVMDEAGNFTAEGEVTAKKFNATESAGQAEILAGQTKIEIETTVLTEKSLIFATPVGVPVAVATEKIGNGKFVVRIEKSLDKNLKINWWVVN